MQDAKTIKENLENLIDKMSQNPELFCKNPGKDFTRNRKLGFNKLIHLMLGMRGNSISKELYDYFKDDDLMTSSAFVQQRDKLKIDAFKYILNEFNNTSEDNETYEGYYLYAIDGSDINIATNPESETYIEKCNGLPTDGLNQFHVNAMYDVLNKTYKDCIIQPRPKMFETKAAWQMIDRNTFSKSIILADRGYGSLNLIQHIINKENTEFLIRAKNKNWIKEMELLPMKELDVETSFIIVNKQDKETKELVKKYKGTGKIKNMATKEWDFANLTKMSFRIVRFKISDDTYETIVTSLDKKQFPISKIKELYHLRWGIETSFRELKYAIGMVNFHAKKEEYILQEIYARLIMYNFCERITKSVVIKQDENRKWTYQVNFTMGIHIYIDYFRYKGNDPPDVNNLISKYILPVREGRTDKRKLKPKLVVYFLYRVA